MELGKGATGPPQEGVLAKLISDILGQASCAGGEGLREKEGKEEMVVQEKAGYGGVVLMEESLQNVSEKAVQHPGNSCRLVSTYCMLGSVPHEH